MPMAWTFPRSPRGAGRVPGCWLHNTTSTAAVGLRPWIPSLVNHAGESLPADAVTFVPAQAWTTSTPIRAAPSWWCSTVGDDARPGTYHGQILIEHLPDVVFPLTVHVRPSTDPPVSDGSEPLAGLARYGAVVTDALFARLASVGQADYLAAPMREYPSRAGKGLRPSLCLATCEAFGGAHRRRTAVRGGHRAAPQRLPRPR